MNYPAEMTAQQRAALITVRLIAGERMTTRQVTDICGYTNRGAALFLMDNLSMILPLCYDDKEWYLLTDTLCLNSLYD